MQVSVKTPGRLRIGEVIWTPPDYRDSVPRRVAVVRISPEKEGTVILTVRDPASLTHETFELELSSREDVHLARLG